MTCPLGIAKHFNLIMVAQDAVVLTLYYLPNILW